MNTLSTALILIESIESIPTHFIYKFYDETPAEKYCCESIHV